AAGGTPLRRDREEPRRTHPPRDLVRSAQRRAAGGDSPRAGRPGVVVAGLPATRRPPASLLRRPRPFRRGPLLPRPLPLPRPEPAVLRAAGPGPERRAVASEHRGDGRPLPRGDPGRAAGWPLSHRRLLYGSIRGIRDGPATPSAGRGGPARHVRGLFRG